ncbi:MAG: magnesium transporter [Candidatus Bathyarchaeia archaeon]
MTHAGSAASFSKSLREALTAFLFNIGGLLAGFLLASQLGVFRQSSGHWAFALYPAVLSAEGVIQGLLSGRLGTALHLGTVSPRFSGNTKTFYKLIEASVVLTLVTSVAMSAVSLVIGDLFWGIGFADLPTILLVVVSTMAMGLALLPLTVRVAFFSFRRGLDPDVMVYPVMGAVATVFVTFCYVVVLNVFFRFGWVGQLTLALLVGAHLVLVLYLLPRNLGEPDFTKTVKESLAALMVVALVVNLTGTVLRGISQYVNNRAEVYTLYPAVIGVVSDVGSVVGSTAATKLALGMLKPRLSSIANHGKNILSAWLASLVMFMFFALLSLVVHGIFSASALFSHLMVMLVANVIAVILIVLVSFGVSIVTFQKGLDPGNFVIPIENSFAASVTSVALLAAIVLLGLG